MECVEGLRDMIYEIDTSGDGTISPEEIKEASENEILMELVESIDLPYNFSLKDLHCMLDKDGDGELTKNEFYTGMRRMIFSNDFQRQALMALAIAQQKRKLFEVRQSMDENFTLVHKKL